MWKRSAAPRCFRFFHLLFSFSSQLVTLWLRKYLVASEKNRQLQSKSRCAPERQTDGCDWLKVIRQEGRWWIKADQSMCCTLWARSWRMGSTSEARDCAVDVDYDDDDTNTHITHSHSHGDWAWEKSSRSYLLPWSASLTMMKINCSVYIIVSLTIRSSRGAKRSFIDRSISIQYLNGVDTLFRMGMLGGGGGGMCMMNDLAGWIRRSVQGFCSDHFAILTLAGREASEMSTYVRTLLLKILLLFAL